MIFTKLRYKNLLSTGNQWTEIELNKSKTTLVVGENGSGKSTMLDALSFVLFNKPFRPDFNKPQLVNSINNKGLVVEIEFHIGSREYKIIRGIKPAIFEVYEDDRLLNEDANVRDYQDYLEKTILKVNHRSFCQVVILGSANYMPFMKLPAQFRREVVEDILDLKIFSIMNSLLAVKKQQNESTISENQSEKKLLAQRIELIKQHTEEITATNNQLIQDKNDRIDKAYDDIEVACKNLVENLATIEGIKQLIIDKAKQLNLQKELTHIKYKLESKISNLKKGIDFFHDHETCPTCSQEIDPNFKYEITGKKQHSLNEASDGLVKVSTKLKQVNFRLNVIQELNDDIINLEFTSRRIESNIEQYKSYIKELESEIKLIESHNRKVDKQELINLSEQISDLSLKYNQLISRRSLMDLAGILLKDSGIKSKIIKQFIPVINKLVNKYLSMLDFFVKFELDEHFNERVLSRYRDEFTYGSFSEGEKFRINLALMFTWRAVAKLRNSINTNILFLDEVFDSSLDLSGTEEFLKIINQTEAMNVVVISHKVDQLYDKFENVIVFQKHKNFSRIVSNI